MFGQSAGQYYYGDCVKFENDAADAIQPQEGVRFGQSVVLNTKTRRLYVKVVNATAEPKKANIDLSRFGVKGTATKTLLTGEAESENNYEQQPVVPTTEQVKTGKRFSLDVAPYSMTMLEYKL